MTTTASMRETAAAFVHACDAGDGWAGCQQYCTEKAGFEAQSPALAAIDSLEGYVEWVAGLAGPMPGNTCEVRCFAVDEERSCVIAWSVFHATHTGEGGPVAATGQTTASDYVYVMHFDGDRIRHVTKIWNDAFALAELGWA